jgi:hypothetical protein
MTPKKGGKGTAKPPTRAQRRAAQFSPAPQMPMPEPERPVLPKQIHSVGKFRSRLIKFWGGLCGLFPRSGKPHPTAVFYFWFGIPFGLLILGVEMTSNYTVAQWAFVFTLISAVIMALQSLVVLRPFARWFWTATFAIFLAFCLTYFYRYLCPTAIINPTQVSYGPVPSASNGFSQTRSFRIQNKTDDDIYAVVVKLRASGLGLSDFRYGVPKSSEVPLSDDPRLRKMGDIGGVDCTDLKGRPVWIRIISHLGPHDSREMTLTQLDKEAEQNPSVGASAPEYTIPQSKGGVVVDAKITGFTQTSAYLDRPGTRGTYFQVDEELKCGTMVYNVLE